MSANLQLDLSAASSLKVPSVLRHQSWAEYHSMPAMNMSRLKPLDVSPKEYQHRLVHPLESDALRLGIAAHAAVLEPTRFITDFAVWRRRGSDGRMAPMKEGTQYFDAFRAENPGREIISEDEETIALNIQTAILSCPEAVRYLGHGDTEVTLLWRTGDRDCKGRVDCISEMSGGSALVGLKTAADIRLDPFSRAAARLLYHCSWAYYHDGWQAICGEPPIEVVEIVVSKTQPYDVVVYVIGDDTLKVGRAKYLELLQKLDQCERDNHWPGVDGGAGKQIFALPSYMYDDEIYA